MRQGTTPAYTLTVVGHDLTDKTVFVTLKDAEGHIVTKTGEALTVVCEEEDSVITFRLSQEETFMLSVGTIRIQVRFIDVNGIASATDTAEVNNLDVLLNQVISYGQEG